MQIFYEKALSPNDSKLLKLNGWQIYTYKENLTYNFHLDKDGLYCGRYLAYTSSKDFNSPKEAMFQIEQILEVDVISDTDHDGGSIHTFRWDSSFVTKLCNPNISDEYESDRKWTIAMGWDCAVHMYDCKNTARKTAEDYYRLLIHGENNVK